MLFNCPKCGMPDLLADEVVFRYGNVVRYCKKCRNTLQKDRRVGRDRGNEHKIYQKNYHLTHKYGLTIEEFQTKLDEQSNVCAVCKQPNQTEKRLAVDHCHETNKIRDLLCYKCNGALGLVNDNIELLLKLIEYLKKHQIQVGT